MRFRFLEINTRGINIEAGSKRILVGFRISPIVRNIKWSKNFIDVAVDTPGKLAIRDFSSIHVPCMNG